MTILDELAAACPTLGARPGCSDDAVDGVSPSVVAHPAGTAEVAATMALAARRGLRVVARGAGTKLAWGLPPLAVDLVVDVSGMGRLLEHSAGDLVLRAEAGAGLAAVEEALAPSRQWLPLDEVVKGSTLGGIVATGLAGPSRHSCGAVRDLLVGITVVRADGVVARAGGKVVKNVAGYDLCKLFTGSYGTLAVVTEVAFRLRPLPFARRFLRAVLSEDDLGPVLAALRRSQAAPAAVEVGRDEPAGPLTLTVLVEGRPGPLDERAGAIAGILGAPAIATGPPPGWGQLPGELTVKVTAAPGRVADLVRVVRYAAEAGGLAPVLRASAGVGVAYVGLAGDSPAPAVGGLLAALRSRPPDEGSAMVLRGPLALREALDPWGPVPGLELMRRLKAQFDPGARLAPGRFVGGI